MAWYDIIFKGISENTEVKAANTNRSNAWVTIVWSVDADMTITLQGKCADDGRVDLEEWSFTIWSDPDKKAVFNSFVPISEYKAVITDYVAGSVNIEFNFQ